MSRGGEEDRKTTVIPEEEEAGFDELIRYTLPGYLLGLLLGAILDQFGLQTSALGNWVVRTLTGESESFFEGVFALRQRIQGRVRGMAEAYGWGKLIGVTLPWVIDWGSRAAGLNVSSVEGFYIPYFYGMSDQIMANFFGIFFLRRQEGEWGKAFSVYIKHPVMVSGLVLILTLPGLLLVGRILGFSPRTQVLTALETIVANLCWIPPLIGSYFERRGRK
jgi:hypothetical protein